MNSTSSVKAPLIDISREDESVKKSEKKERNLGIDALRIISMLMVVTLHVLGQGGILFTAEYSGSEPNFKIAWLLEIAAFGAVNCYAMISGYVGVKSKFKYSNIIMLWLQVFFYTGLITLLFSIFYPAYFVGEQGIELVWNAFFPAIKNQYWYFTAYFAMFFFIPFFNYVVNNMPKRQVRAVIIAGLMLFSVVPLFFRSGLLGASVQNAFYIFNGYNVMWLSMLYLVGAYISKYRPFENVPTFAFFIVYIAATIGAWLLKFYTEKGAEAVHYTSPFIFVAAAALVMGFSRFKFKFKLVSFVIRLLTPATFGVFLIHTHPLIWSKFMWQRYVDFAGFSTWKMVLAVFAAVFSIYFICSAIDLARYYLFKLLHIQKGLSYLESKITRKLWEKPPKEKPIEEKSIEEERTKEE